MQQLACLLLICLGAAATATKLPHFSADQAAERTADLERDGKWWAHLGDHVYHAPPSSSGLSGEVGDYYFAFGSADALSPELRDRRVGGQGRLHIFHLPEGPAMLQVDSTKGNRRNAISTLTRLKEHMKVSHTFPPYKRTQHYVHPLSADARALEKAAVSKLTPESMMSELKEVTSFRTRSFENPEASADVQGFLHKKFEQLGYTVCEHSFSRGGPATNIVAYAPGTLNNGNLVIIGAHYDDIPAYGSAPGAEDNGSGTAALLAIAKAFKDTGLKTKSSVAFVAFAGEEPGLLGSEAYAHSLLSAKSHMDACLPAAAASSAPSFLATFKSGRKSANYKAIIMDEVGWESPALARPTVNLEAYDWTEEVMEQLAQSSEEHNGESLVVVHSNNPFGSDHMSFLNRRIPAVLTINGDDEAYPCYHQSCDKIELVSGELVSKIAKMNMGALLRLAGLEAGAKA